MSSWTRKKEDAAQVFQATPAPLDLPPDLHGKPFLSISAGKNFTAAIVKLVGDCRATAGGMPGRRRGWAGGAGAGGACDELRVAAKGLDGCVRS